MSVAVDGAVVRQRLESHSPSGPQTSECATENDPAPVWIPPVGRMSERFLQETTCSSHSSHGAVPGIQYGGVIITSGRGEWSIKAMEINELQTAVEGQAF